MLIQPADNSSQKLQPTFTNLLACPEIHHNSSENYISTAILRLKRSLKITYSRKPSKGIRSLTTQAWGTTYSTLKCHQENFHQPHTYLVPHCDLTMEIQPSLPELSYVWWIIHFSMDLYQKVFFLNSISKATRKWKVRLVSLSIFQVVTPQLFSFITIKCFRGPP